MSKTKSIVLGLVASVALTGAAYASYLVWSHSTGTTVAEPVSVDWDTKLPDTTYPNQTYPFKICITNANADGNGTQMVGVVVTKSSNLDGVSLSDSMDWNSKKAFSFNKGESYCLSGEVKTPSDMTPASAWVNYDVSRE